jgi:hypothetical protein
MESISFITKNEVIGRLRISGLSMKDFAQQEGYEPDTVRKVVTRYVGTGKKPRGALSSEIIDKLSSRINCLSEFDAPHRSNQIV